jgi:hypothetical protein
MLRICFVFFPSDSPEYHRKLRRMAVVRVSKFHYVTAECHPDKRIGHITEIYQN